MSPDGGVGQMPGRHAAVTWSVLGIPASYQRRNATTVTLQRFLASAR